MAGMIDVVSTLRRRIGDTDANNQVYTDDDLSGYISDAVAEVELDYQRGYQVNFGIFNQSLNPPDVQIFAIRAHYLIKLTEKDKADRNNLLMKKGRLTIDNTQQSKDHAQTLETILAEYKRMLWQLKNNGSTNRGIRLE